MLVQIGSKPPKPVSVSSLLLDCHERIRSFTALARKLSETPGLSEEEIREVATRIRRYFREALPRHIADEDESILPRLQGRDPAVDRELAGIHTEHRAHEPHIERVVSLCAALEADPARLGEQKAALGEAAARLEAEFTPHLAREEKVMIPAIQDLLSPEDQEEILREIRARRTLDVFHP